MVMATETPPGGVVNTSHPAVVLAVGTFLTPWFCSPAWLGLLSPEMLNVEEERPPGTHGQVKG